jgi:hypothetical protein
MRIRAFAIALCGVFGVATGMVVASLATSAAPQVSASVESCHRSSDGSNPRSAVFVADMRAVGGTRTMAIRLDLQRQRGDGAKWRTIRAPGLGEWHRSEPRVDIFRYRKMVTNLTARAGYRAVARYRWYGAKGAVIARAKRVTSACRQPDPRPDLVASDLVIEPGPSTERSRYVITLRNKGRQSADAFDALVYVDGTREGSITVPDLGGRARQAVAVEARRCGVGSTVLVVLDPSDRVDESRESNNTTRFTCPL